MRRLAAAATSLLLLAGCSGDSLTPAERLQDGTAAIVDQANARDLAGLREATSALRQEIEGQLRRSEITAARARLLLQLLADIERNAPLVAVEPTPSAAPTEEPSPTPSPTSNPTPSPTSSPTPSPTSSPTPSPTPEQSSPAIVPTFGNGGGNGNKPTPTPTAS